MKLKLILSTFLFFSITFCHAQKLTPEILHGQWKAVAVRVPGEFLYNSLSDSLVIENKEQLKHFQKMIQGDSVTTISAYDRLKKETSLEMQKKVFAFDEKGNMVNIEDKKCLQIFSKKKGKFTPANYDRWNDNYISAELQNGLLLITLSEQFGSKALWLQKL